MDFKNNWNDKTQLIKLLSKEDEINKSFLDYLTIKDQNRIFLSH